MTSDELPEFAQHYAKAWSSQNPESVAALYAENGSLSVNDGPPAVGRAAIAEEARGFMTTFPDMVVTMDDVSRDSDGTKFHWTLTGTSSGSGGTEKRVRISGYELWQFDHAGSIAWRTLSLKQSRSCMGRWNFRPRNSRFASTRASRTVHSCTFATARLLTGAVAVAHLGFERLPTSVGGLVNITW